MDEDNKVVADARESFGKGAARKLRAVGKIPAVVYGHGTEPRHVALPAHQVGLLIRKANAVLDLQIDGKSQLALGKEAAEAAAEAEAEEAEAPEAAEGAEAESAE